MRQAVRVNGLTEIALTKLDVLSGFESIKVCVSYDVNGENILEMPASLSQYRLAKPVYESLLGGIIFLTRYGKRIRRSTRNLKRVYQIR